MGHGSSCIKDNDCNFIKLYTMKHEQNGQNFEDHIFKITSMKENVQVLFEILLKFVLKGHIDNMCSLF